MPRIPRVSLVLVLLFLLGSLRARASDLVTTALEHQGRRRTFHVYVPPGHVKDRAVPLVLALHGGGGTGRKLESGTGGGLKQEAARRGWVVVFPEGVNKGWNDGRDIKTRRDASRRDVDDVGFLSQVIDALHRSHGIDRTRVYATGISNGGFMSFRLGVELAERIAAIAPVTANMTPILAAQEPRHPVPVLVLNGTADPLVPYAGGQVRVLGKDRGLTLSTEASLRWWAEKNGCEARCTRRWLPDTARDGCRVRVDTWQGCEASSEVVLYGIEGGGHTWPGGKQYLPRLLVGRVCRDFDGTRTIFEFFARHRREPAVPVEAAEAGNARIRVPGASE